MVVHSDSAEAEHEASGTIEVLGRLHDESAQLREQIGAIEAWAVSATSPVVREFRMTSVRHLKVREDALGNRLRQLGALDDPDQSTAEAERLLDEVKGVQLSAQTIRSTP